MRPVDFIGKVLKGDGADVVSHVEGTIFEYEDALRDVHAWQGTFAKWKDQDALLAQAAHKQPLLLQCNDGRSGQIIIEPEVGDWGVSFRFRGLGPLGAPSAPPAWRSLDRVRAEDGAPDKPS